MHVNNLVPLTWRMGHKGGKSSRKMTKLDYNVQEMRQETQIKSQVIESEGTLKSRKNEAIIEENIKRTKERKQFLENRQTDANKRKYKRNINLATGRRYKLSNPANSAALDVDMTHTE